MHPNGNLSFVLKQRRSFILIISVVFLLILLLEFINNRFLMNDFQVYYYAAKGFVNNSQVYGLAFGGSAVGFYKYSPFALFYFIPLSFLPLAIAKIVFYILISAATIGAFLVAVNIIQDTAKSWKAYSNGMIFIVFIVASSQLHRELHLGNVNMILLFFLLLMLRSVLVGKQIRAGILFAIVLFIKPHFIILAPLFVLRKQYLLLGVSILGIAIEVFMPALITGFHHNLVLHKEWIQTMQAHNETLTSYYNTIYSLFALIPKYILLLNFQLPEKVVVISLVALVALVFGWFSLGNIRRERIMQPVGQSFWIEFLILVALVPNLVNTDSEHFLLSIPLIVFLVGLMKNNAKTGFRIAGVVALILYGINIHDLVGNTVSNWLSENGILGIGNLMLIVLACIGYRKFVLKGIETPDIV